MLAMEKCSWTGPPWERNDPRIPGLESCDEAPSSGVYCPAHSATYARWLRNRHKGPEVVETRKCGNPECDQVFAWSSWGQDKLYHSPECKKRHEQLVKIEERAKEREAREAARAAMTEKECIGTAHRPGCGQVKPVEEFHLRTDAALCNDCEKGYMAEYDSQRGPARAERRQQNIVEVKAGEYNLTPGQLQQILDRADGRCEICGREVALDLDHVRETGVVRGMLCRQHNLALGLFQHDAQLLARAIAYLSNEEFHVQPMGTKGRPCERCKERPKLPGHGMRRCAECFGVCMHCERPSESGRGTCTRHRYTSGEAAEISSD